MRDVVFVLIVIGFFAVAVAYVRACAAIAGDTPIHEADTEMPDDATEVAA